MIPEQEDEMNRKELVVGLLVIVLLLSFSICSADLTAGKDSARVSAGRVLGQADDAGGDKGMYDRAYKLYENKKYYDAYSLFVQSKYGDWERMAKKCIRRWPKNGEIYHDNTQWLKDVQLRFRVEQPDDTAVFIRVFKDDTPVSYVFIGGSDEVMISLPGNQKYTIKDGVGINWFGPDDAFGPDGAYETMLFGDQNESEIYLVRTNDYTITLNVDNAAGESIGSEDQTWKEFLR